MTLKVLVVEDDLPTLELMDTVLSSLGAEVQAVGDSVQAADLVNRERFDGIFLDLQMPELDGFEMARRIRQSSWNRHAPIVIVTGRDDKQSMDQIFEAGGNFFLQKPVDRRKLIRLFASVRGAMSTHRQRYTRVSIRAQVVCRVGARTIRGTMLNISQRGMLFEAGCFLEPGTNVELEFRLPGQQNTTRAAGVVARADEKQRLGVRFTTLQPADLENIRALLEERDRDGS